MFSSFAAPHRGWCIYSLPESMDDLRLFSFLDIIAQIRPPSGWPHRRPASEGHFGIHPTLTALASRAPAGPPNPQPI